MLDRRSQRAAKALGQDFGTLLPGVHRVLLPGVHRVASLVKRWLASTHQGAVDTEHLAGYLDEFCFRFNPRTSRSRGLVFLRILQLAVVASGEAYSTKANAHEGCEAVKRAAAAANIEDV